MEVCLYILDLNRRLSGRPEHNLAALTSQLLATRWGDTLEDGAERVQADIRTLLASIQEHLAQSLDGEATDLYDDLSDKEKRRLAENLLDAGGDPARFAAMRESGEYVFYLDFEHIAALFAQDPQVFLDGRVWSSAYGHLEDLPSEMHDAARQRTVAAIANYLQDLALFERYRNPALPVVRRARASCDLLRSELA